MTRPEPLQPPATSPALPTATAPRILLYSPDTYGLGHLRRQLTLAHALAAQEPEAAILCVTGASRVDLFQRPVGLDWVRLPAVSKDRDGNYVPRKLPVGLDRLVAMRQEILRATFESFRPHACVIDHKPSGFHGELLGALDQVRAHAPSTRLICGLRDVLDEPLRARAEVRRPGWIDVIDRYYDEALVYGQPEIFDLGRELELPDEVSAKLHYMGFACSPFGAEGEARTERDAGDPPHVLVCAGGGGDGYPLLRAAVSALRTLAAQGQLRVTVVTGPYMSARKRARLMSVGQDGSGLTVLGAQPELGRWFSEADLVLSMGGYNTVIEGLAAGTRLLLSPRTHPRLEQLERARRFERLGLVEVVSQGDLAEPARLRARVQAMLERDPPDPGSAGIRFDGAARAAERVLDGLNAGVHRGRASASG